MKKLFRFIPLLLIAVLIFSACSATPKSFTVDALSIDLTSAFDRDDSVSEDQDAVFISNDLVVTVLSESFNRLGIDDSFTKDDYAELVIMTNGLNSAVMHKEQYTYFIYEASADGEDYKYLAVIFKSDDAFYMVQFAALSSDFEPLLEDIWEYIGSVDIA